jgi:hypothetical protein
MPGRPKAHDRFRLASGRQLWRLNTLGRLVLTDDARPISSKDASVIIAAAAARLEFVPAVSPVHSEQDEAHSATVQTGRASARVPGHSHLKHRVTHPRERET